MASALDNDLSEITSLFLTVVLRMGYSLLRWQQGLIILLEKVPGVWLVDKLRAILLLEVDYNSLNKLVVASRMMSRIREEREIPEEIFGGIKGRSSREAGLVRAMIFDLLWKK